MKDDFIGLLEEKIAGLKNDKSLLEDEIKDHETRHRISSNHIEALLIRLRKAHGLLDQLRDELHLPPL
jgi:chromosome segregation ATPase